MPLTSTVTILHRGYSVLDRALLPEDEFGERRRAIQRELAAAELTGVFVFGDADDYADVAYLGGTLDGATVFVPAAGEPVLVGGPHAWREQSVLRQQTWLRDFRFEGEYGSAREALAAIVEEHGLAGSRVGVVGVGRTHSPAARDAAVSALGSCSVIALDEYLAQARARTRPREHRVLRSALGIARAAADAGRAAFAAGGGNAAAMVAAERAARLGRARDVRLLANLWGTGLQPPDSTAPERWGRLALYVAVDYQGYWADAVATFPASPEDRLAAAAVAAQRAALSPGVKAGEVAVAARNALPATVADAAAAYGFGGGLGLSAADEPVIADGSNSLLGSGSVVSLRAVVPGEDGPGLACSVVAVDPRGARPLEPEPPEQST